MQRRDFIIVLLICIAIFIYIETVSPYNFSKADNIAQFLPVLIEGYEQIFDGYFPSINLHQYMGNKVFETGTYAFFYPPLIVSYLIAHYVIGNDYLLLEIFAFIHIIGAYCFSYLFLRRYLRRDIIAALASLAFVFSGYALIWGSNWYYVLPTLIFLPLILHLNDRIERETGLKTIFLAGIIRAIYFYSGNAQYFVYTLLFEFLYMLIKGYQNRWKGFGGIFERYALSMAISIVISLPLAFAQMMNSRESPRSTGTLLTYLMSYASSPRDIVLGSLLVHPVVSSHAYPGYSGEAFIHTYYSGTIFSLLFILGGVYLVLRYRKASLRNISPMFWLGLLAIILSMGYLGIVYAAGAFVPFIKNFSNAFKITLFSSFFTIMFGAIIGDRMVNRAERKGMNARPWIALFSIVLIFLLFYHSNISTTVSGTYYGDEPPLNESFFRDLGMKDGRIMSVYTNSSLDPRRIKFSNHTSNFPESILLSQNFATFFDVDHLSGYEPFIDSLTSGKIPFDRYGASAVHLNITTLGAYGVRYILMPKESLRFHPEFSNLSVLYENKTLIFLKMDTFTSYVSAEGKAITYKRNPNGFEFETGFDEPKNVTINLLYKPEYKAFVDGQSEQVWKDEFGRMYFEVPAGKHSSEIKYVPMNLIRGMGMAVLGMIIIGGYIVFRRRIQSGLKPLYIRAIKTARLVGKSRKAKIVLVIIIITVFAFLVYDTMTDPRTIEMSVNHVTGISLSVGQVSFNPFTLNLALKNNSIKSEERESFHAELIEINTDLLASIKETLKVKRPLIIFKEVEFSNTSISVKNKRKDLVCDFPLFVKSELNLSEGVDLQSERIKIESVMLSPFNRVYLAIVNQTSDRDLAINGHIRIEKYVSGNISLGEGDYSEHRCIRLPLEKEHIMYYN